MEFELPPEDPSLPLLLTTGGTIESFYEPKEGTPAIVPLPDDAEDSCIPMAMERLGITAFTTRALLMRDSNEFTDADVETLFAEIINSPQQKVMVVHGTDTMPTHAQALQKRIDALPPEHPAHQKVIVFAGGMGPLRNAVGEWRDEAMAWEILQMAWQDLQALTEPGVYVEMGKGPWRAHRVEKYKEQQDGFVTRSGFTLDGVPVALSETRGR